MPSWGAVKTLRCHFLCRTREMYQQKWASEIVKNGRNVCFSRSQECISEAKLNSKVNPLLHSHVRIGSRHIRYHKTHSDQEVAFPCEIKIMQMQKIASKNDMHFEDLLLTYMVDVSLILCDFYADLRYSLLKTHQRFMCIGPGSLTETVIINGSCKKRA